MFNVASERVRERVSAVVRRTWAAMAGECGPDGAVGGVYTSAPGGWEDPMGKRPFSVRPGPTARFYSVGKQPF